MCLSVLLCVLRENNRLNVHVSVQGSTLSQRNGLATAFFSCSNQGEYSFGPVYLSLPAVCPHASSARSGGGLCVCVCVCMRSFRGVEALGREQADLVSWLDPQKHSQQCDTLR